MPTGALRQAPAAPDSAPALTDRVAAALDRFLAEAGSALLAAGEEMQPLLEAARSLVLGGGKRLRPAFCYWGWRGAGAADGDEIVTAAASLELLHACALIHDDVMDASRLRRGQPAAHRRFSSLHERSGWTGSSRGFGEHAAILLGDLCLVWADAMLNGSGLDVKALHAAGAVYADMRVELLAGQYLDVMSGAAPFGADTERPLRIARLKTAAYTVAGPLRLGGTLAGAPGALLDTYTAYGLPLGEAFQLRDDLLGLFGDPAVTGKPAGDDLREGRRTTVLALARARSQPAARSELDRLVGAAQLDASAITRCQELIAASGAVEEVEELITLRTGQARIALAEARSGGTPGRLNAAAYEALDALAERLTRRTQ